MQPSAPSELLVGELCELRRATVDLAGAMHATIAADRERLARAQATFETMKSVDDVREHLTRLAARWDARETFAYGVHDRALGHHVGNVGVHTIAWEHASCELGYWIGARHEGRGLISEAIRLLDRELFAMGFHRIEIRCNATNARSVAVPRRNGYLLEGVLRDERLERGVFHDVMVFAKLASDVPTRDAPL
jgi:hypothetical protein